MTLSAVEQFDKMLGTGKINTERGQNYGHPLDDFALAHILCEHIADMPVVELRECANRIQVKIARLVTNPYHVDGWIDIAGYARCAVMIIDELQLREPMQRQTNICLECAQSSPMHANGCPNAHK